MKFLISFGLLALILTQTAALSIGLTSLAPRAPIGLDGRVLDTPEVTAAKTEHAIAHLNERINLVNEAARSADLPFTVTSVSGLGTLITTNGIVPLDLDISQLLRNRIPTALVDLEDTRIPENSEVRLARAEQAIAQLHEKLRLGNDPTRITDGGSPELQ